MTSKKLISLFLAVIVCFSSISFVAAAEDFHIHSYSDWILVTEPTCDSYGLYKRTCSGCGNVEEYSVDPKNHEWDEGRVIIASTCSKAGQIEYKCKNNSSHTYTLALALDSNVHEGEGTYTVGKIAAGCKTQGYTGDVYCKGCNKKISDGQISPAIGTHTFEEGSEEEHKGEWEVVYEATLYEEGTKRLKCKRCPVYKVESIPKLEALTAEDVYSGISLVYAKEYFENKSIELSVKDVFLGDHVLAKQFAEVRTWDVKAIDGLNEIKPTGEIEIKLPVPSGYNKDSVKAFYLNTGDGSHTELEIKNIEDGYATVIVNFLGVFAVVDADSENPYLECTCLCHERGLLNIIYKIIMYIQRIFGINDVCECGNVHYVKSNVSIFEQLFPKK